MARMSQTVLKHACLRKPTLTMSRTSVFGEAFASELAEIRRQQLEEFDAIDDDTVLSKRQLKRAIVREEPPKPTPEPTNDSNNNSDNDTRIEIETATAVKDDSDISQFLSNSDIDSDDNDDDNESDSKSEVDNDETMTYIDCRPMTMFRYQTTPNANNRRKQKSKFSEPLSNVRNRVPSNRNNQSSTNGFKSPFLNQTKLRQTFSIDRGKKGTNAVNDKTEIRKIARNNLQFLREILRNGQSIDSSNDNNNNSSVKKKILKKTLLNDSNRFFRRVRFSVGVENKRRSRNYREFQHVMNKRENRFAEKKEEFWRRGLRVSDKMETKVLVAKYGRRRVYNAGVGKNKGRRLRKIGGSETAKAIHNW